MVERTNMRECAARKKNKIVLAAMVSVTWTNIINSSPNEKKLSEQQHWMSDVCKRKNGMDKLCSNDPYAWYGKNCKSAAQQTLAPRRYSAAEWNRMNGCETWTSYSSDLHHFTRELFWCESHFFYQDHSRCCAVAPRYRKKWWTFFLRTFRPILALFRNSIFALLKSAKRQPSRCTLR